MAGWRNDEEDGWVDLPGPASWWPKSEAELDATGFYVPTRSPEGYVAAMEMVWDAEEEPKDYKLVLPSEDDLWVMEDTAANRDYLDGFYSS